MKKIKEKIRWALYPYKKGVFQYTTFKRWCKFIMCYYLLNREENYLLFGNWEEAMFLKKKPEGKGNYHGKMILKGNGKYEEKYSTEGWSSGWWMVTESGKHEPLPETELSETPTTYTETIEYDPKSPKDYFQKRRLERESAIKDFSEKWLACCEF
jgi:hypothetical protein